MSIERPSRPDPDKIRRRRDLTPPAPGMVMIGGVWTDTTAPTRAPLFSQEVVGQMQLENRRRREDESQALHSIRHLMWDYAKFIKGFNDQTPLIAFRLGSTEVEDVGRFAGIAFGYLVFVATRYGGYKLQDEPYVLCREGWNIILSPGPEKPITSFVEWLKRMGGEYQALLEIGEARQSPESDNQVNAESINGIETSGRLFLTARRIAELISPDGWRSTKRIWDNGHRAFKDIDRIKPEKKGQANRYDAFAFIERAREREYIFKKDFEKVYDELLDIQDASQ